MRGLELLDMVRSGVHPIVRFKEGIEQFDIYFEEGMLARVIEASEALGIEDSVYVVFSFKEFVEYNKSLEKPVYFDRNKNPTLRCSETPYYPESYEDSLYLSYSEENDHLFEVLKDDSMRLFDEFLESRGSSKGTPPMSYVQWLEKQLISARQGTEN
ncbi:hypothetical protein [Alicyclobacillus shizuokensis]|uniref:hypothetical protein n=1 Tax=Alicyclobacillus shizuokensis TaxID=392014 RepID=UPI00082EAB25|nr:hypothetical protein [Alicyclobacillus shizuokensis]